MTIIAQRLPQEASMHRFEAAGRAFVSALALAGCANGIQEREAQLAPLIGRPETELVQRLGVPTRTYETDGSKFLAYNETRVDYDPGFAGPYYGGGFGFGGFGGYGGFGGFGGFPPEVYVRTCETTFQVSGGTVSSFSLHGNSCNYGTL